MAKELAKLFIADSQVKKAASKKEAPKEPVPKYADLYFYTKDKLNEWLNTTTKYHVELKDKGQDLTNLWLDENGEVLYVNQQSKVWCSKFVDVTRLKQGKPLYMWIKGELREMDFIAKRITTV